MSSSCSSEPLDKADTAARFLGPWLIGTLASFYFSGTLIILFWRYFATFETDRLLLRRLVSLLVFLNILRDVQDFMIVWNLFVTEFGDWGSILLNPWPQRLAPMFGGIMVFIIQGFFGWRLFQLLKWHRALWFLLFVIATLSLTSFAGCIVLTVFIFQHPILTPSSENVSDFNTIGPIYLGSAAACDILITLGLIFHLLHARTGFGRMDRIIGRLVHITWITAAPPALCAVANIVLFNTLATTSTAHMTVNLLLPKLYTVSMMVSLNSRSTLTSTSCAVSSGTVDPDTLIFMNRFGTTRSAETQHHSTTISFENVSSPAVKANRTQAQ